MGDILDFLKNKLIRFAHNWNDGSGEIEESFIGQK